MIHRVPAIPSLGEMLLFETAIGTCGVRWSDAGITAVELPRRSLTGHRRTDGPDVPDSVRDAVAGIVALLAADGSLHGFSAPGGIRTKRRMLEIEGAPGFTQEALFA